MTLSDLKRMTAVLSVRRLCHHADIDYDALRKRIRRGSPELTRSEVSAIRRALKSHGLYC